MNSIAYKKNFLLHESIGTTSLNESYQIFDIKTKQLLAYANEEPGTYISLAKLFLDKAFLPTKIKVESPSSELIMTIERPARFFLSEFKVISADGKTLCSFKQKLSLTKSRIAVVDGAGQSLGEIVGGWRNRNFEFKDSSGKLISGIRHKFAGLTKELFTTADDFEIEMVGDSSMALISLAASICIDFMYHE